MGGIEIRPTRSVLGAEITGVDLRDLGTASFGEIYGALLEHQVLFFRRAGLNDAEHLALAGRFGPISVFPAAKVLGSTEPTLQAVRDAPESPPVADHWHTDVTWTPEPPKLALLRAVVVPDCGGDTLWGSMTAAYEALSPALRGFLDGLRVRYDCENFIAGSLRSFGAEEMARTGLAEKLRQAYPPVEHPLVRTHPETGARSIFFGGSDMAPVVGLSAHEGQAMLRLVREHIENPRFHCRWSWEPGDLVVWDERSTLHRALSDHYPRVREMRRCVVDGDRPYHTAA